MSSDLTQVGTGSAQLVLGKISKPVLWTVLKLHGLKRSFLNCVKDLHWAKLYAIKSKKGGSLSWTPERGLREGCPTTFLFKIFHQMVIKLEETKRRQKLEKNSRTVLPGIIWNVAKYPVVPSLGSITPKPIWQPPQSLSLRTIQHT